MGLFEEYPWLLVPIIIATTEAWALVKAFILQQLRERQGRHVGG